jgi:hypothetical protein
MRAILVTLLIGLGLAAAASVAASACQYHAAMASNDQSAPTQTAEAQPATGQGSY